MTTNRERLNEREGRSLPFLILLAILVLGTGFLVGYVSPGMADKKAGVVEKPGTSIEPFVNTQNEIVLPEDDGYAGVIFFGADTRGSLKDCGCPKHPEGGLIWRMGYSRAFADHSSGVPTIQADAGYIFSDARGDDAGLTTHARKQNDWVVKAYNELKFGVANLTVYDLPYAEHLFSESIYKKLGASTPMLKRLISANVRARKAGLVSPSPYLIQELNSDRVPGARKLRVAFVGLTERGALERTDSGFTIEDPLVTAERVVPKVRSQSDVVVVLAYLPSAEAETLAQRIPGIDLIVNAYQIRDEKEAIRINRTTIAYARTQTRSLGEALLYVDRDGRLADIRTRMVRLDDAVPRDTMAEQLVNQAEADLAGIK